MFKYDFVNADAPREVQEARRSSDDVYRYLGTPVLIKKMYTWEDVKNGVAQEVSTWDDTWAQSSYANDIFSHGVGICSVETQPDEWVGVPPDGDPNYPEIVVADTAPFPWYVQAPKYRGYGPGFLTYAVLPDRPEDQWKLTEQGALIRTQTATVQLPWYPEVGDNDILIIVSTDAVGNILETFDRYQLKEMSAITMHGIDRRGKRESNYPVLTANNNRFVVGYTGEITKVPTTDQAIYSIETDR